MAAAKAGSAASDDDRPVVVVVGGGLIGLCSAYYLAREGARVVVLERGRVGGGAARYNAGMVTTCVTPLPAPGVLGPAARTAWRADSAIRVAPRPSLGMLAFFARFARHCTSEAYARGERALGELNARCFELFDELAADGVTTGVTDSGYLICCESEASLTAARDELAAYPYLIAPPGPVLRGADLATAEPALSPFVHAGFISPRERWTDASVFVDGLTRRLCEMGVEIVQGARVTSLTEDGAGVRVCSTRGRFDARAAVVAAGAWSDDLCAGGRRPPLQPGKGYSFTVPMRTPPRTLLYLSDAHVVATPLGERVRIAGTMEFDGTHERFEGRRVAAMVAAARRYLHDADWDDIQHEWVAPRPMTPDGLPYIGRLPGAPRVVLATGHNMLGLTLGPPTGSAVAALALGRDPDVDLAPFAPARFS